MKRLGKDFKHDFCFKTNNVTVNKSQFTINNFFLNRIEYDAYRTDLELLSQTRTEANAVRLDEATQLYEQHKINFEKLRSDVTIKLKFLDENRVSGLQC